MWGEAEGVGNPLKSVEEIRTEALAVPIGTIEPDAQRIGGTGRKTACKQHPAEVKVLLSSSLTAVEINRGTKKAEFRARLAETSKIITLSCWTSKQVRAAMRPSTQPFSEHAGFYQPSSSPEMDVC